MTEYFYDKYALNIDYEEISQTEATSTASSTVYADNIIEDDVSQDGIIIEFNSKEPSLELMEPVVDFGFGFNFKNEYEVVVNRSYGGIKDYKFVVSGDTDGLSVTLGTNIYRKISDHKIEKYITIFRSIFDYHYLWVTIQVRKMAILELEVVNIVTKYSKGALLYSNVIRDGTYPVNWYKNGYWWVRGKPFTIPAPELISPENAYLAHESDSELPYFVFELTSRTIAPGVDTDNNEYHARLRIGDRSDFANNIYVLLESKEDQSLWEYYDGSDWQPFPAGGVNAGTKVRVKPDINDITDWGFYYWDATAYNSNWGYGQSNFRMFVFITATSGGAYQLTIGGRRYYAIDLNIQESTNGELGQIDIKLVNNKI